MHQSNMPVKLCQELWKGFTPEEQKFFAHSFKTFAEMPDV